MMDRDLAFFIAQNTDRILKEKQQQLQEEIEQMIAEEQQEPKQYELDISTIQTIEDVKAILDGLELIIADNSPKYESVKRYFKEIE